MDAPLEAEVTVDGDAILSTADAGKSHTLSTVSPPPSADASPSHKEAPSSREPRVHPDVTSQASMVVLQHELTVLETLVELQVRKLRTLEQMRATLLETRDAVASHSETITGSRRHRTQEATRHELHDAVDRKLEAVAARVLAAASAARFDSHFIEKARIELSDIDNDDEIVDVHMGKLKTVPTSDLVVIGTRAGRVRVLLASGQELLRLDTPFVAPLVSVQLDTASDPPLLVVLSRDTTAPLRVFALDVRLQEPDAVVSVVATEIPSVFDAARHGAVRAVAIARSTRRSVLSVAHDDGTLGFYAVNGTLLHELATHATRVATIVTHRHVVAFANGTTVVLFPMTRQRAPEYQLCHGSLAEVSSIAFDPVFSDVVYAGTAAGELLTFQFAGSSDGPARPCRLLDRTVVARGQTLQLAALKGYVAAASPTELVVLNVTRVDGVVRVATACSTRLASDEATIATRAGRLAVSENGHATLVGVVTTSSTGVPSLLILQSLLASTDSLSTEPNLWRGATFMGIIVVVVLSVQFFFRRRQTDGSDFKDGDKWRALLEKHTREASMERTPLTAARSSRAASSAAVNHADRTHESYLGDPTMYGATADVFDTFSSRSKHREDGDDELSSMYDERDGAHDESEQLERKIAEARRETLECSFDNMGDEDEEDEAY